MSPSACPGPPTGSLRQGATSSASPDSPRRPARIRRRSTARTVARIASRSTTSSGRRSAAPSTTAGRAASPSSSSRPSDRAVADELIGVVGAGTMGAGIAQLALENGHEVVIHDVDDEAIARGRSRVRDGLSRRAAKLELDADSIDDWVEGRLAGLREAETLASLGAEVDVAIEAAVEDLELKREIFRALDAAADADAILATNTSALSVGAI